MPQKELRQTAGGVEGDYGQSVAGKVGETRGESGLLGKLQIRGLGVLRLDQERTESPIT
jgi:hypothetical protein